MVFSNLFYYQRFYIIFLAGRFLVAAGRWWENDVRLVYWGIFWQGEAVLVVYQKIFLLWTPPDGWLKFSGQERGSWEDWRMKKLGLSFRRYKVLFWCFSSIFKLLLCRLLWSLKEHQWVRWLPRSLLTMKTEDIFSGFWLFWLKRIYPAIRGLSRRTFIQSFVI